MYSLNIGKGEDILFLHGWGGDTSAFLFFAEQLAPCYRCTLVDFCGFGKSPEPDKPMSVSDYTLRVLDVMKERDINSAVIVAHSFGGRVAIELAAKYPDKVRGLVLVDSAGLKPRRKPSYYFRVIFHKIARKLGGKGLKGSSDYRKLSPVMKETFKKIVSYDQTRLLGDIKVPTAIFWGSEDKDTPPYMARKMNKKIADSHIFWLEGGHFAYLFSSAAFLSVLSAFLSGVYAPKDIAVENTAHTIENTKMCRCKNTGKCTCDVKNEVGGGERIC